MLSQLQKNAINPKNPVFQRNLNQVKQIENDIIKHEYITLINENNEDDLFLKLLDQNQKNDSQMQIYKKAQKQFRNEITYFQKRELENKFFKKTLKETKEVKL